MTAAKHIQHQTALIAVFPTLSVDCIMLIT